MLTTCASQCPNPVSAECQQVMVLSVKHSEYSNTKTVLAHIAGQFSQVLKTVTEPASYVGS